MHAAVTTGCLFIPLVGNMLNFKLPSYRHLDMTFYKKYTNVEQIIT